ncbi:cystathione beta-lyase [Gracilibacillus ureilyticus]|uniref:cysteine-S-conjugate beta-lyase n=1 Tax=Gracilibacillus ureilyticus TaxID=531814 RepID=A0A1H9RZR4_9BACI|nr:PatB family C-S lyase [Gracilibacillus ureilyticus]SER77865.1 cystathione beta-lyase [Gracilibacillus ureilyticus]
MNQQFEQIIDRKNTRAAKWDLVKQLYGSEDVLPMWVADMDFQAPEAVTSALSKRAEHGIFGYTMTDKEINKAVTDWLSYKHEWEIHNSWLLYSPGVITTLHMAIQTLTEKGDKVMIQTPVYPPFYQIVNIHERQLVKNQLQLVDGKYEIDFEDMENQFKKGVKAFILCNPHNPVGRVWTRTELEKMISLCLKYNVYILADEIHADLVYEPNKHIPIASLNDAVLQQSVTCMSPTKTFNLAGLQVSYAVIPNKEIRKSMEERFHMQGIHGLNTMGIVALEAAYNEGKQWLTNLSEQLKVNLDYVTSSLEQRDDISVIKPEGTYLVWLDFRALNLSQDELRKFLQEKAKIGLNDGITFGDEGTGFMRINIATPLELVKEGIQRLIAALDERKKEEE